MTASYKQKKHAVQARALYRTAGTMVNRSVPARLRPLLTVVVAGAASITLYALLFIFSGNLVELSASARLGNLLYALVPIVIALVFSLVHGAFTAFFWDLLGLRAKK